MTGPGLATLKLIQENGFLRGVDRKTTGAVRRSGFERRASIAFATQNVGGMFGLYFAEQCPATYEAVLACDKGPSTSSSTPCSMPAAISRRRLRRRASCRPRTATSHIAATVFSPPPMLTPARGERGGLVERIEGAPADLGARRCSPASS